MGQVAKIIIGLLMIVYPVAIYFGLKAFSMQQVALLLLAIFVLRLFFLKSESESEIDQPSKNLLSIAGIGASVVGIVLLLFVAFSRDVLFFKLYPVFVNLLMLLAFVWTLINPPSAIERIARKLDPELSALGVIHTRQVTQVWCAFFLVNGCVAAYTCFFSTMETWALYNGLISYLLMGALFALEFVVRVIRMRRAGE